MTAAVAKRKAAFPSHTHTHWEQESQLQFEGGDQKTRLLSRRASCYLFVRVVVGVDVVVKLLVSQVLLLTQLAVEESLQSLRRAAHSPLRSLLQAHGDGENG